MRKGPRKENNTFDKIVELNVFHLFNAKVIGVEEYLEREKTL